MNSEGNLLGRKELKAIKSSEWNYTAKKRNESKREEKKNHISQNELTFNVRLQYF